MNSRRRIETLLAAAVLLLTLPFTTAAATAACTASDATLTWGFKESFRSYISGTIANGEWTVSDGATYETPTFGWANAGRSGDVITGVEFVGAVRFTGHGGILDTTIANPRIDWLGSSGTLYLDVAGTTQQGDPIDATNVPFATLQLGEPIIDGNDYRFVDVTATLTEEGATSFGTYPSGEPLDPLSFEFTLQDGCVLPQAGPPVWLLVASIGFAVLVSAALVAWLVIRRRRRRA